MAAMVRVLSNGFSDSRPAGELAAITIFCGLGLSFSLLLAAHGLDLSVGSF